MKTATKNRLDNERDILRRYHARPGIRQMLDETRCPSALVLKHVDHDLLSASNSKRLEKSEIKQVAKGVLRGLRELHGEGYVHTGMASSYLLFLLLSMVTLYVTVANKVESQISNQIMFLSITVLVADRLDF